jgi:hypothetical protein
MNDKSLFEFAALLGGNRAEAIQKINNETSRTNLSVGTLYGFYKMTGRFPNDDEVAVFNPLFKLNQCGFPVSLDDIKKVLKI